MTTNRQLTLPSEIVKKSNQLVRSRLRFDVLTAKVFTAMITQIRDTDPSDKVYSLSVRSLFPVDEQLSGSLYKYIDERLINIMSNYIEIPRQDEPQTKDEPIIDRYSIFSKCTYIPLKGVIEARFDPDLKPHLRVLAEGYFTSFKLFHYLMLSSTYAQRLFEILSSYAKSFSSKIITLEELHFMLGTPSSLQKRYPDFRRKVLELAHKEISEKTDLEYTWEPVKKKRAIHSINFIFTSKAQAEYEKREEAKERARLNKYVQLAHNCFKNIGKENFVDGKCPNEKKQTLKCRYCKKMYYFLQ